MLTPRNTEEAYQKHMVDELISQMHDLTDLSDEQIFDEVMSYADADSISEFEKNYLAERLGIS